MWYFTSIVTEFGIWLFDKQSIFVRTCKIQLYCPSYNLDPCQNCSIIEKYLGMVHINEFTWLMCVTQICGPAKSKWWKQKRIFCWYYATLTNKTSIIHILHICHSVKKRKRWNPNHTIKEFVCIFWVSF